MTRVPRHSWAPPESEPVGTVYTREKAVLPGVRLDI